ncbi:salicylate synthase [Nocardia seriolae]|uniref:Isochorismate synthase n=1 Tax=Nocardia seriolae TaxID=37332 RepID=A0A0B8N3I2_9NOCA|nr:Isochorismate synthase [Nocardia seriolae]GEM22340.1 putative anthranilate synthase component I TrpE2/ Salicylate synthase MbtI [Nocardia seriolae NBRC 15557]MTJ60710.1 salicylate synthase [Nocardia seriolae]MTJ70351.1 salicylate synthase [Nocardia seriolae]MTJ91145.1 salicylate synthase [Nocardia seriolae]
MLTSLGKLGKHNLGGLVSVADERVRVTGEQRWGEHVTDPAAAVSALAAAELFGEYVVYERPGEWVFAADPIGGVELDADELRVSWDGRTTAGPWTGSPAQAVDRALAGLPSAGRNAFGWIGFEFCAWSLGAIEHVHPRATLAHLMIPRIEVRIDATGVRVSGATPAETGDIHELITTAQRTAPPVAHPVDVTGDPTGYRDRVAAGVAEIADGRYQKVILSRKVELPFAVDIPATYRLGRMNNTPARSFLLRLGGLEAAGFSPELVASVDRDRVVTTEPLAGTRAFGRGDDLDLAARAELIRDPKEIVEHAISVQTSFAEIAAVAEPDTTAVSDFMAVRERGSVQHLASTVRGTLAAGRSPWDALETLFPSVTASGIPKAEGVDAVFRLDHDPRGLYSGAVVTVSPEGELEATLVLRAVYQSGAGAWLRAGAGVVGQSRPEREFEETCEKLGSVAPYVVKADTAVRA